MTQLTMTGEDWLSDRDRKAQAKAEAARARAARKTAKALQDAAEAVSEFKFACLECGDGSATLRADDGRDRLSLQMREYSAWLERVYS